MSKKSVTVFESGLVWFGAAVSIAEIITGTYLAPLGLLKGSFSIVIGHIIGGILLFLTGLIGGKLKRDSMEAVKVSFGQLGSRLFAMLNIVQLIGWTGIMINDGAIAADNVFGIGKTVWVLLIGALIILWILIGIGNLGKLNTIAMSALFVLTIVLSVVIFNQYKFTEKVVGAISFGAAVELSVAMPLSWLPLISDYTGRADKPVKATAVSAIVYSITSSWMYFIGIAAALFTQETEISRMILKTGLGVAGLIIIILSTVTTTFMDAYSAGVSSNTILKKSKEKAVAVAVTCAGVSGAIFLKLDNITEFLYFIGSVFAPMIAIMIADVFILKRDSTHKALCLQNIIIWIVGFVVYRLLMKIDIITGNTLPSIIIVITISVLTEKIKKAFT